MVPGLPPGKDGKVLKDMAVFSGWVAGIILIAGLTWFLTQPIRSRNLMRAVNRVLEQSGSFHRLTEPYYPGRSSPYLGSWYRIGLAPNTSSETFAYVFAFFGEGSFFPCVAIVNNYGEVTELIPLNRHGERILSQITPGLLQLFVSNIERTMI